MIAPRYVFGADRPAGGPMEQLGMILTLRPTATIDTINGNVEARIWEGTTDQGVPVKAWIATISPQTHDPAQLELFDAELKLMPYSRRLTTFDMRLVL